MSSFTNVVIIFNPNSTGNAKDQADRLKADLAEALPALPVELMPTQHAGHAIELSYAAARATTSPLIVSASGDGGYNEVINGALRAQGEGFHPTCAVLPSGNANDHARTMQDDPLADLIVSDKISQLDVLKVSAADSEGGSTVRYAHSYVGLGLTPTVAVELNKHTLNSLKEAWIVLRTFWSLHPVVLEVEGKTRKIDSLICSIIPEMAKMLTLSDKAAPDDGLFEMVVFEHNRKFRLLLRLIKGVFSHLGANSRIRDYRCTVVDPAPIQLDGEVMELKARTDLEISICPGLLRTVV
jgi:diacylglycerol kinase family enzyme